MLNDKMHRWRFYRFFRVLTPALLLVLVLSVIMLSRRASGVNRVFPDDAAYADLAVARVLWSDHTYGLHAREPSGAGFDAGWRILLAAAGGLTGDAVASGFLLNLIFSLITLLAVLRMTRLLFPFPPFGYFAIALLILSPGLTGDALSGTSASLATCLVTVASLLHMEGIRGMRSVLPLSAAVLIGGAVWLRVEFALVWLLFFVHALVLSWIPYRNRPRPSAVVFRGINGILMILLLALPLLAWNMWVIQVPWPRFPGVPMSMDAWSFERPAAAFSHMMELVGSGWPEARARLGAIPVMSVGFSRFLVMIGIVLIVGLSFVETPGRPFTLTACIVLLFPLLYALVYPYTGWFSADRVMRAFHPVLVVTAAYGVFRLPFAVEKLVLSWKPHTPTTYGFRIWWVVVGGVLMLMGFTQGVREHRAGVRELLQREAVRSEISRAVEREGLFRDVFITDEPGWPAYRHDLSLIDLSGQFSLDVLLRVADEGRIDPERLRELFELRLPGAVLLWRSEKDDVVRKVPDYSVLIEPDEEYPHRPWFIVITWPGVL